MLLSTLITSVTCGPFWPGATRIFKSLPRLHGSDAVAFENAGVEEGVSRAVGQLDKPETPFGLEPFHDGAHRRAGWRIKRGCGEARRGAKIAQMRVITVVVEIAAAALTEIPVSDQVGFLSSRFTARGTAEIDCSKKSMPARAD